MSTSVLSTINQLQSNTNQVNFQNNQSEVGQTTLSNNDFLELLMAQLQYQDPQNPTDDSQFLSEQASMAQVNQMQDLATAMETSSSMSQAAELIGKTVTVTNSSGTSVTGNVESASFSNGTAGITINGTDYNLNEVTGISGPASATAATTASGS